MLNDPYMRLSALWQARKESEASKEARLRAFLRYSRTPGRRWYGDIGGDEIADLTSGTDRVPRFLAEWLRESQTGEYAFAPGMGSMAQLFAFERSDEVDVDAPSMLVNWGTDGRNYADINSNNDGPVDPRFITYDVLRANVLAMAAAFEPEWCKASPVKLSLYHDYKVYNRPAIGLCWMVWLCPGYARLVDIPSNYTHVTKERYADGSLFLSTGTDAFDCDNAIHVDCARDIQRQIDPLNYTVSLNGLWGRNDRVPPFPKV